MSSIVSSKKTLAQIVNNKDGFYFWNNKNGSFMDHGLVNPVLSIAKGGKFRINCLESAEYIRLAEKSEEPVSLRVTIQCVNSNGMGGGYISCRREFGGTRSSLAEYRQAVGDYEVFEMIHCDYDNSYIFKAHNGLYLHNNDTYHTVAFKTCSERSEGLPVKGRWDLLLEEESDRRGKYSASWSIPKQIALLPISLIQAPFKATGDSSGPGT
ncbi:expressed unknown protein [Seminavis robusta]|uniref:Uncharacterized protein n=1 Tax=Seminavis robusta TaxID=568900 RepID=A0A9N8HCN4_9STRA|nr:expressed unknown protein [Seminavis robusta]|eukprot:Sro389_g132630.1 n/a (211) ;mRNA; r:41080-41712